MPFQPCPYVAQINIRFELDGQQIENVIHAKNSGAAPVSAGDCETLALAVVSWWEETLSAAMPTSLGFREVVVRGLDTEIAPEFSTSTTTQTQGQVNQAAMPNNATFCVSFRTGLTGRSSRGRVYIPAVLRSAVTENELDSTSVTSYVSIYADLGIALDGAGYIHVVLSRTVDKALRTEGQPYTITAYLATDNVVDSQRRRLPGRGR
jgi:hypothetical protein